MSQDEVNRLLFEDMSSAAILLPKKPKRKWRPREEREAARRDREIRRERREAKRAEKEERRKRREAKALIRAEVVGRPPAELGTYQPRLRCRDCGGGMIVAMPRDPETGNNQPVCERCEPQNNQNISA
jgi:formylmethanofuran dehydrogenase subunit E